MNKLIFNNFCRSVKVRSISSNRATISSRIGLSNLTKKQFFRTGVDNSGILQEKSMLLKHPKSQKKEIDQKSSPSSDKEEPPIDKNDTDLIETLSEQLIADTNSNLHKPTMAENEIDSLAINSDLQFNGFSENQSNALLKVITKVLNDEFYSNYNEMYLRDYEIDKQLHLFNSLQSEIQYIIENSRDSQFNLHHLQVMRLQRDLNSDLDEINEQIIVTLEKDRKLEFNNQKVDNTLLYRQINMNLKDCINKISINILAGIKLDIENLRWHTTRNGLMAIVILVFFILTGVNVSNKKANKQSAINNSSHNAIPKKVILETVEPEELDIND